MRWFSGLLGSPAAQDRYLDIDGFPAEIFGGMLTATGLRVSTRDALCVPGIGACIDVLADDLAKVPLALYRRKPGGGREVAQDHRLNALLKGGPAPWLSSFAWRRLVLRAALAYGNAYSRVHWNALGVIDRITPNKPGATRARWTEEGEPVYDFTRRAGTVEKGLSWQDILHLAYKAANDDSESGGALGVSPIDQYKESVALCIATERFAARFFANGARPSLAVEFPGKFEDDAVATRTRKQFEAVYAGVDNSFKVALLELGMKLKEISFNNSDSQLMEIRRDQAHQNCTMYGVPPHKIGLLDRSTNNNIEHQGIEYVTGPISSLAKAFESAITITCLAPAEREEFYVEHNLEGLMRGDIEGRYNAYAIGRQWGWLSVDEIREWENQNPLPDGQGTTYMVPLNMVPADQRPEPSRPRPRPQPNPPRRAQLLGPDGNPLLLN